MLILKSVLTTAHKCHTTTFLFGYGGFCGGRECLICLGDVKIVIPDVIIIVVFIFSFSAVCSYYCWKRCCCCGQKFFLMSSDVFAMVEKLLNG